MTERAQARTEIANFFGMVPPTHNVERLSLARSIGLDDGVATNFVALTASLDDAQYGKLVETLTKVWPLSVVDDVGKFFGQGESL